jgi:hypothetical protein
MNEKLQAAFVILAVIYCIIAIGARWLEKNDQD